MEWTLQPVVLTILTLNLVALPSRHVWAQDNTCNAHLYQASDDVDVKIDVILGFHDSIEGRCKASYLPGGLQQAMAIKWATELLNGGNGTESFIPGVRFGVDLYDDCYLDYLAAKHAGTIAAEINGVTECSKNQTSASAIPIAGVIGTSLSKTTTLAVDILKSTNIPIIGISATLPDLGDKTRYPNFVRTVPSDLKQAQVIIELAKYYSWSYIVGVRTKDNYGIQGMEEVQRLAQEERICISFVEDFSVDSKPLESQMEKFVRDELIRRLDHAKGSIGVVYFGQNTLLKTLLQFVEQQKGSWGITSRLQEIYWIASDAVVSNVELAQLVQAYGTKILVVSPPWLQLSSFEDYFFQTLEDPPDWVKGPWRTAISEVIKTNYECSSFNFSKQSLQSCGDLRASMRFSRYLTAAVDATYFLANTLKTLHTRFCAGAPGPCPRFTTILNEGLLSRTPILGLNYSYVGAEYVPKEFFDSKRHFKNVSGDFEAVNEAQYSVQASQNDNFILLGTFKDGKINITNNYSLKNSECKAICTECRNIDKKSYIFMPGDYIILGIYSIHSKSDSTPYQCGSNRQSRSYIAMLAFLNSIDQLRQASGIDFGYLVLDDCYNVLTASHTLNKIFSGDMVVEGLDGRRLSLSQVVVAIGAQSSPVTMAILPVLQDLNIPLISYSATNLNLDNAISYPYFSRTVSSDSVQAKAIMRIVKELGVTYVGAIIIQNSYGMELYKLFRSYAEAEGICVDDAFEMTETTSVNLVREQLQKYRERTIKVIVAIIMDTLAINTLRAVIQEDTFVFIASEAWGPYPNIIADGRGERARGSLVFGAFRSVELDYGLREYLQTLDPFQGTRDGWLMEFWQDHFRCNLPGGFTNDHGAPCQRKIQAGYFSNNDLQDLVNSPLAVHSTLATMSAGRAVEALLNENTPFDPAKLTQAIRSVSLTTADNTPYHPFTSSGSGSGGFQIYNIQLQDGDYTYIPVGVAMNDGDVDLNRNKIRFYEITGGIVTNITSSCLLRTECEVCSEAIETSTQGEREENTPGPGGNTDSSSDSAAVIALSVICGLLFLIVLAIVILGVLIILGRVNLKRFNNDSNGVGYSVSSGAVSVSRAARNSYVVDSTEHSGNSLPPPLPAPRGLKPEVYSNRAFSDIVTANDMATHTVMSGRNRSQSEPTVGDDAQPFERPSPVPGESTALPPPRPHVPIKGDRIPPDGSTSSSSHPSEGVGQSKVQSQLRAPVFYLRGTSQESTVNPHGSSSGSGEPADSEINELYSGRYRNEVNPSQQPNSPQPQPIIFHNKSDGSDAYSLTPLPTTNTNMSKAGIPPYVYLPTSGGPILLPYDQFVAMNSSGTPVILIPPNLAHSDTSGQEGSRSPQWPGAGAQAGKGATVSPAQCNPVGAGSDYITPINVEYASVGQQLASPVGGSSLQSVPKVAAPMPISHAAMSAARDHGLAYPVVSNPATAHKDFTYTVSSNDYPHLHSTHLPSHLGTEQHRDPTSQQAPLPNAMLPPQQILQQQMSSIGLQQQPPNSIPQQQPPNGALQQPRIVVPTPIRPNSLPLMPMNAMAPQQNLTSQALLASDTPATLNQAHSPNADQHFVKQRSPDSPDRQLPPSSAHPAAPIGDLSPGSPKTDQSRNSRDRVAEIGTRQRNHVSPARMARPRMSDVIEVSGEFNEEVV